MASTDLEKRVAQLEEEVARLKARNATDDRPWWKRIAATFENDPLYEQAMKLGRQERRRLGARSHPRKDAPPRH